MSFFEQALNSTSERSRILQLNELKPSLLEFYNECLQNRRKQWISTAQTRCLHYGRHDIYAFFSMWVNCYIITILFLRLKYHKKIRLPMHG